MDGLRVEGCMDWIQTGKNLPFLDKSMALRNLVLFGLLLFFLTLGSAWLLCAWVPGSSFPLVAGNLLMALGALGHCSWLWGWPRGLLLFGISAGLTFLLEALSLATGLATPYYYTAVLGPRFLGVPVIIPLGWFSVLYLSHVVVNLMVDGGPRCQARGHGRVIFLALLTALVMSSWDLTLDPYMVQVVKAWVWLRPSGFLGIPFANFVSWLELTFIICLCYRVAERGLPHAGPAKPPKALVALPVVFYGLIGLAGCFAGLQGGLAVLPPFTMGIAVLGALGRLAQMGEGGGHEAEQTV